MPRWFLALALAGCGRLGFDLLPGADAGGASGAAPWQLIQTAGAMTAPLSVTPPGAGHLVVVAVDVQDGSASGVTDDSTCNTYVEVPAARAMIEGGMSHFNDTLQVFYAKNTCGQPRMITVDVTSGGSVTEMAMWEVSGMRTDDPLDTATAKDTQNETQEPLGPAIRTSQDGEFVVSVAVVDNNICETADGTNSPPPCETHPGNEFTNDQALSGNGYAHLTDPHAASATHQAEWDQLTPGVYGATAAAFRAGP
jgi:hypothetical protein